MPTPDIRARLDLDVTPELDRRIKRMRVRHSIAEDRRDLDGLISAVAPDCVYEIGGERIFVDRPDAALRDR